MAITQVRGNSQLKIGSIGLPLMQTDFLSATNWNLTGGSNDATLTGLIDPAGPQDAATKHYVDGLIGTTLKAPDSFDPTDGDDPATGPPLSPSGVAERLPRYYKGTEVEEGDTFYITAAGDINVDDGTGGGTPNTVIPVNVGDMIVVRTTPAGGDEDLGSNWFMLESNRDQATEDIIGMAELSSEIEARAGINHLTIITPLRLQDKLDSEGIHGLTFENGLVEDGSNVVKLGGALTAATTVGLAHNLIFDGVGQFNVNASDVQLVPSNNFTVSSSNNVSLSYPSGSIAFDNATHKMVITDSDSGAAQTGIEYADDYSDYFVPRSLVDKAYVDDTVASGVEAGNGLTLDGVIVELGGALDRNTGISANGYNLTFDGDGSVSDLFLGTAGNEFDTMFTRVLNDISVTSTTGDFLVSSGNVNFGAGEDLYTIGNQPSGTADLAISTTGYANSHLNGKPTTTIDALNTGSGPTVAQDGFALVWDNTSQEYVLTEQESPLSFINGLTENAGIVELGGTLTKSTNITFAGNDVMFFSNGSTNQDFNVIASSPTGYAKLGVLSRPENGDAAVELLARNGAGTIESKFELTGDGTAIITGNVASFEGIRYDNDYSGNFIDRSLIDRAYADTHIASQDISALVENPTATEDGYTLKWDNTASEYVLTAEVGTDTTYENGLTQTGSVVTLGGPLTEDTNIQGGFDLNLGHTTALTGFSVTSFAPQITASSGNINMTVSNGTFNVTMQAAARGITYTDDYSGNYTPRSLVDKAYVDGQITAIPVTTASNGLNAVGDDIQWGGPLTGAIAIDGAQSVAFGGTTPLTAFDVTTTAGIDLITTGADNIALTTGTGHVALSNAAQYTVPQTFTNDRELVDKGYVDGLVGGVPVITASNGLTRTLDDITLGGTLGTATDIASGTNTFSVTGSEGALEVASTSATLKSTFDANVFSSVVVQSDSVVISATDNTTASAEIILKTVDYQIDLDDGAIAGVTTADGLGLQYTANYVASFVDESLVSKRYVDLEIAAVEPKLTRWSNEMPTVTNGSAAIGALSHLGTHPSNKVANVEVYLNGVAQAPSGNDYTLDVTTGIITFTFTLSTDDLVLVHYNQQDA